MRKTSTDYNQSNSYLQVHKKYPYETVFPISIILENSRDNEPAYEFNQLKIPNGPK